MADDGANDGRINKGIAHHEFPSEIFTSTTPLARKAQQLLADVEFNIESTGNRIVLFANSDTTAKIISSPAMKQALLR